MNKNLDVSVEIRAAFKRKRKDGKTERYMWVSSVSSLFPVTENDFMDEYNSLVGVASNSLSKSLKDGFRHEAPKIEEE